MLIARSKQEILNFTAKSQGKVAFVPTMGALHAGHLSLIELAKKHASTIVASIFVNPTQFGPNEDFAKYPRTEKADVEMLEKAGCHAVFIPGVEEIYPTESSVKFSVVKNANILCGKTRPGHFDGVVQVVSKLFNIVQPDIAIFGEKDFQQLHIIKAATRDLNFNIEIIGAPILREADGLAMSSRNQYLDSSQRKTAAQLNIALKKAAENIKNGIDVEKALADAKNYVLKNGFDKIDYVEARNDDDLGLKSPTRIFAAAFVGKTRLIDNWKI